MPVAGESVSCALGAWFVVAKTVTATCAGVGSESPWLSVTVNCTKNVPLWLKVTEPGFKAVLLGPASSKIHR